MQIESCANELFLDVFQYLTTSQIYHAFHDLNSRFNALIVEYFRTRDIDFRSISKFDFDIICQHYLPQTIDRIVSLCLSDDDDTPGQIDQFLSHGFTLRRFINLQSLFLHNIRCEQIMEKLMIDLPALTNLTHLTFEQCVFPLQDQQDKATAFVNSIWSLPKLVYCCFKVKYKYRQSHHFVNSYRRDNGIFILPTITSSTLECLLSVGLQQCDIAMNELFTHTPHLRRLLVENFHARDIYPSVTILSMTTLTMSVLDYQPHQLFFNLLQIIPNLRRIKVKFGYAYSVTSGQQWEQIIRTYLPKLERLQFKMSTSLDNWPSEAVQIDTILNQFRSPFWLVEHQWFVQCDWNPGKAVVNIYTLPYAFDDFRFVSSILSKSTFPYGNHQRLYHSVHNLMYKPRYYNASSLPHIQFYYIQHLSIELPITTHFWSIIPSLDRLISLDVLSNNHDELCQQQLQELLDRAPRLSSVRINWKTLTSPLMQLFNSQNLSVYQLELLCFDHALNKEQCRMLSSIIPGIHCKVLNLVVADRACVLELAKTLSHLYALNIRCQNDKFKRCSALTKDPLREWLQQQLSLTFSNMHVSRQDGMVRLWIR